MYYIIVDTIDSRMYYKGVKEFQGREYNSYCYNKDEALKINNKNELILYDKNKHELMRLGTK